MSKRCSNIYVRKATAKSKGSKLNVCLISDHALVLDHIKQLLGVSGYVISLKLLGSTLAPDLRHVKIPRADIYIVDAHATSQAIGALLVNIHERSKKARLIIFGDKQKEAESMDLLWHGVRGIVNYSDAQEQLPRALVLVAGGGFWVRREVISRFLDSISTSSKVRIPPEPSATGCSAREQEVLTFLLENFTNQGIATRLKLSVRTVKFHVSNILAKFKVCDRAELIRLCHERGQDCSAQTGCAAS